MAAFPCWAYYKSKCSCWGVDASTCGNIGGQYCSRPESCVDNCKVCESSTACKTCNDGYFVWDGECATNGDKFSGSTTSIYPKGNLMLFGNKEAYDALSAAYAGSDRYGAIEFAARGFLNFYKDVFDGIIVIPYQNMAGTQTNGQQWGGSALQESNGRLQSLITLQNYGSRASFIPLLHEVGHRWGVFNVLPGLPCCHWGMSAMDKQGHLGGFGRDTITCKSGTYPNCNTNAFEWDFDAGSTQTSNDGIGAYSKYELLLMGLYSAAELASEEPLVYCADASKTHGSGKVDISCSSIEKLTPAQVSGAISESQKKKQIARGDTVRMVALVLFPSSADATAEAQTSTFKSGSDLDALNSYIEKTPGRFREATYKRASMSFAVNEADKRGATGPPSGRSTMAARVAASFSTRQFAAPLAAYLTWALLRR
eukprot:TRINITY_DN4475_c0_g1_i1.p1 TRINITY_DN4475_c0_g1~~TRINITY_DN4475_c0_g1_i1.p1  ORF type:complete len:480 (-),score=41.55 TRINITY_DN4475_c0_g1_i1:30-1307(-)